MRDWKPLEEWPVKALAQQREMQIAEMHGCEHAPGGQDAEGPWYVYHFYYTPLDMTERIRLRRGRQMPRPKLPGEQADLLI